MRVNKWFVMVVVMAVLFFGWAFFGKRFGADGNKPVAAAAEKKVVITPEQAAPIRELSVKIQKAQQEMADAQSRAQGMFDAYASQYWKPDGYVVEGTLDGGFVLKEKPPAPAASPSPSVTPSSGK